MLRLTALILLTTASLLPAQQVTIGVTEEGFSDNWYGSIGGSAYGYGPGYGFTIGGYGPPVYGGYFPGGGIGIDYGFHRGPRSYGGAYFAGQGRSTIYSATTPYLTVTNGVPGSIFVGRVTPFVTGIVPVGPYVGPGYFGPDPAFLPELQNLGAANTIDGRLQRGEFHLVDGQVVPGPARAEPRMLDPADDPFPAGQGEQPAVEPPPPLPPGAPEQDQGGPLLREPAKRDSPRDAAALREAALRARQADAANLLEKGNELLARGRTAAVLLYQTALPQATGRLKAEIESRLETIEEELRRNE